MNRIYYLIKFLLLIISSNCNAFNIEPYIYNSRKTHFEEFTLHILGKIRSRYTDPVHETITALADFCSTKAACNLSEFSFTNYDENPIIIGVRWNDDPLLLIPGNIKGFKARFDDAKKAVEKKSQSMRDIVCCQEAILEICNFFIQWRILTASQQAKQEKKFFHG